MIKQRGHSEHKDGVLIMEVPSVAGGDLMFTQRRFKRIPFIPRLQRSATGEAATFRGSGTVSQVQGVNRHWGSLEAHASLLFAGIKTVQKL